MRTGGRIIVLPWCGGFVFELDALGLKIIAKLAQELGLEVPLAAAKL